MFISGHIIGICLSFSFSIDLVSFLYMFSFPLKDNEPSLPFMPSLTVHHLFHSQHLLFLFIYFHLFLSVGGYGMPIMLWSVYFSRHPHIQYTLRIVHLHDLSMLYTEPDNPCGSFSVGYGV